MSFQSLGLDPALLKAVQRLGYTSPTQVQAQGIPAILAGRDVIGSARTGSGKTAAFLLPINQRLTKHPARKTRVLILSPTRELAVQTETMLKDLAGGKQESGEKSLWRSRNAPPRKSPKRRSRHSHGDTRPATGLYPKKPRGLPRPASTRPRRSRPNVRHGFPT